MVRFGEVVRDVNEAERNPLDAGLERFVGLEHIEPENLHLKQWGSLADDEVSFTKRFRKGQVLFGKRRAYQRKVAVAEFDGICSSDILTFETKGDDLLPELLPFIVQSEGFFEHALGTSSGSLSPRTRWSQLQDYEFPLPPKDEQRRIADFLWAADEYLEALRVTFEATREVRRCTLLTAYRQGFGHTEFVDTPIGPRPSSWRVAELQDFYEVQLGKMISPKSRDGEFQRPYIRNANVQWNRLELDDVATMSFSPSEVPRFELRYGDILACEGRHVGKSAIWRNEIPGACYQKALHRLRPRCGFQVPEFMLYQMEFASLTGVFSETTGETTIPHLPAERLRTILFSFPPQDEQRAIADRIAVIDAAVSRTHSHIAHTKALSDHLLGQQLMCKGE